MGDGRGRGGGGLFGDVGLVGSADRSAGCTGLMEILLLSPVGVGNLIGMAGIGGVEDPVLLVPFLSSGDSNCFLAGSGVEIDRCFALLVGLLSLGVFRRRNLKRLHLRDSSLVLVFSFWPGVVLVMPFAKPFLVKETLRGNLSSLVLTFVSLASVSVVDGVLTQEVEAAIGARGGSMGGCIALIARTPAFTVICLDFGLAGDAALLVDSAVLPILDTLVCETAGNWGAASAKSRWAWDL